MKTKGIIKLNKWHFKFGVIPIYRSYYEMIFNFGIFKIVSLPVEGEMITKKNYKGFWIRKRFTFKGIEISF